MIDNNSRKISGARVRIVRNELDLTQDELAEALGLSQSSGKYISQIECGNRALPARHAQKLIDMAIRPTSYKWLMGVSEYRSEAEATLHNLAVDMVNHEVAVFAINKLAEQYGYLILPPNTRDLEIAFNYDKHFYFISKDGRFIVLSSKELVSHETLISDFVKLQLDYLFTWKRVLPEEKILETNGDNNG